MNSTTIAVDVAKAVFEVAVSEHPGQVRERHRFSRERFRRYLGEQPPATILMEACGSAHYWGRQAQGHGHRVTLLPPHVVRPYVPRNKTDRTDAKGLLEAARNDEARPVPVKSESQQAVAALHRLRSTWLATRTARINTVRGLLREFGVIIPTGARHVVPAIGMVLEDIDAGVPRLLRPVLAEAAREIRELEARLRAVDLQLDAAAQQMPVVERLRSIPGLGLLTTTALGPTLRKLPRPDAPRAFDRPAPTTRRHQQAWGSLPPHAADPRGARGTVSREDEARPAPDRLRIWALQLERARGHNKAAVALANKLARIAWAVWKSSRPYTNVTVN